LKQVAANTGQASAEDLSIKKIPLNRQRFFPDDPPPPGSNSAAARLALTVHPDPVVRSKRKNKNFELGKKASPKGRSRSMSPRASND